jgi:hypothetical protein
MTADFNPTFIEVCLETVASNWLLEKEKQSKERKKREENR